jgi:hypothetical protein
MVVRQRIACSLVLLGCGVSGRERFNEPLDAAVGARDASPNDCENLSLLLVCPDADVGDAGACPALPGFPSVGAFPVRCYVLEGPESYPIDGSCFTPALTCVAGAPSPSWAVCGPGGC